MRRWYGWKIQFWSQFETCNIGHQEHVRSRAVTWKIIHVFVWVKNQQLVVVCFLILKSYKQKNKTRCAWKHPFDELRKVASPIHGTSTARGWTALESDGFTDEVRYTEKTFSCKELTQEGFRNLSLTQLWHLLPCLWPFKSLSQPRLF